MQLLRCARTYQCTMRMRGVVKSLILNVMTSSEFINMATDQQRLQKRGPYRLWMVDESRPVPRTTKWRNANKANSDSESYRDGENVYCGLEDMEYGNEQLNDSQLEDDESDGDNREELELNSNESEMDDEEFLDANESDDREELELNSVESEMEDDEEFLDADENDDREELDGIESDNDEWDSDDDEDAGDVSYNLEGMFEPIYENAKVTVCGAYCAIMKFKSLSGCSFTTLGYLLQLFQLLCPSGNRLPKSVYMLRKFFKQFGSCKSRQQYCLHCGKEVTGYCSNAKCPRSDPDCLILIDTEKQFQSILSSKFIIQASFKIIINCFILFRTLE